MSIKNTELFKVLLATGKCKTEAAAIKKIRTMQTAVLKGKDPEPMLHRLGLEPDYVMDLF